VMVEERRARVETGGFAAADSQTLDGRAFQRWAGTHRAAGDLAIALPAALLSSRQLLTALVAIAAAVFVLLAWLVARRRRTGAAVPSPAPPDPGFLADAIARLDARYQGREGETPAEEWTRYQAERARLLALLSAALATRGLRS